VSATVEAPVDVTAFNWCTGTNKRITARTYDLAAGVDVAKTGRLVQVDPPAGAGQASTRQLYDADGRASETQLVVGSTVKAYTKTTYDPAGRVLTTSVPSPTGTGDAVAVSCYNRFGEIT